MSSHIEDLEKYIHGSLLGDQCERDTWRVGKVDKFSWERQLIGFFHLYGSKHGDSAEQSTRAVIQSNQRLANRAQTQEPKKKIKRRTGI